MSLSRGLGLSRDGLALVEDLCLVTVEACMPPTVSVPKPGPCPGSKRGLKSTAGHAVKTLTQVAKPAKTPTAKPTAKAQAPKAVPKATPKTTPGATGMQPPVRTVLDVTPAAGPGAGRQVPHLLNSEAIAALPMYDAQFNDQRLVALASEQGFDAPARVVSTAEADELLRQGGREIWRGVMATPTMSAAQIHQRSNTGPLFFGQGQFGNGSYFSSSHARSAQFGDGSPGSVQRAVLSPQARLIAYPDLLRGMATEISQQGQQYQAKTRTLLEALARGRSAQDFRAAWNTYKYTPPAHLDAIDSLKTEPSAWAIAHGYDAYTVPGAGSKYGADEIVVLNRSAYVVDGGAGKR